MTRDRIRADLLLVEHGHFESRARAQAAIAAGLVRADGRAVIRASERLPADAAIEASAPHPFVSRGGLKLEVALDAFGVDPAGLPCLDVGASTGGFTDLLLRRGAAHVTAVDVGHGQLHASLAADPRVENREGTDIRTLAPGSLDPAPRLAGVDVSFIALRLVLPAVAGLMAPGAPLIALIKPQFEAGRERVGRGGIVRDEGIHAEVCDAVRATLAGLGFTILGLIPSPVRGGDGNTEFLVCATAAGALATSPERPDDRI